MDQLAHEVRLRQWAEIIQAQCESNQNKTEWCRNHNIPVKSFFYWQRLVREELYESQAKALVPSVSAIEKHGFVEVPVAQNPKTHTEKDFQPAAVISVGTITISISESITEELLMNIGKMVRNAL